MSTDTLELRGLDAVRMDKERLLERIKKNRDEHRKIYEEAMEGWKRAVITALEQATKDALEGKAYHISFHLPQPEDHTDEYDTVIELLEASLDDEFELTYGQFSNYVLDKWGWQHHFLDNASGYGSMSATKKL